jgi:hypothetical protein
LSGTSTSTVLKVSNSLVAALEPYLHADEWESRTQTNIIAGSGNGIPVEYQVNPSLLSVYIAGDSIDFGVGIKTPSSTDIYPLNYDGMDLYHYSRLAMEAVDPNVRSESYFTSKSPSQTSNDVIFYGDKMMINKVAVGGASYANTVGTSDQTDFIHRFDLKFNQLYRTMNINSDTAILIGFGTNDAAYDTSLTAAQLFERESYWVDRFKDYHPSVKVIMATDIKRTTDTTLNARIDALNILRRANYLSIGADYLADFEATHSDFNCLSGTISTGINGLYADNDLVHPSKLGHYYMKNALIPIFQDLLGTQPNTLKRLILTNDIVLEHASIGAVVGTIYNKQTGSTLSLTNDASGKFALSGNNIVVNADIEFTDAESYNITVRETLTGHVNSPRDTTIKVLIGDKAPVFKVGNPITKIAVAAETPLITGATLSGNTYNASVGASLTASTGTWYNTVTSYAYQWKKNGTNISGATTNSYTVVGGDSGATLICAVTATNSDGSNTNNSRNIVIA